MPEIIIFILELLGTAAFAVSGAMIALNKKMDIFGVAILGVTTAVGGGIIRDLILGNTPPTTFKNPIYALLAITVSLILFVPYIRTLLSKKQAVFDYVLLIADSLGLAVFTVIGISAAADFKNWFLLIFVGVITGVGGGVLRDVLAGYTPYIFVKHFYATASLIGAVITVFMQKVIDSTYAMVIGAVCIFVLRICAAHFRWRLPKAK